MSRAATCLRLKTNIMGAKLRLYWVHQYRKHNSCNYCRLAMSAALQPRVQAWLLSRTSWRTCARTEQRRSLFTRAAANLFFYFFFCPNGKCAEASLLFTRCIGSAMPV